MNNILKKGLLLLLIYILVTLAAGIINYLLKIFFGADTPLVILVGIPTILINLFGIFFAPILLPAATCHPSGFMGCESLFGGVFIIFLNALFYFLLGAILGILFQHKGSRP